VSWPTGPARCVEAPAGVSAEGRHSVATGLLAKVRSDRGLGAPYVYSFTTKALRASGYPSVEAMREVIASRFTPAELAAIANASRRTPRGYPGGAEWSAPRGRLRVRIAGAAEAEAAR